MPTALTLALISADVYKDKQTATARCRPVPIVTGVPFGDNFYGAAYVAPGNVGIIAFRGSQELEDWVYADGDIARNLLPIGEVGDAFSFYSACRKELLRLGCQRLIITGHSLGGGLAAVVAAGITSTPVRGVTFNAPGMAVHKKAGNVIDDKADRVLMKAVKDVGKFATKNPLAAVGALEVAAFAGLKKVVNSAAQAMLVSASAEVDLKKSNAANVFNFRAKNDVVSGAKGNHIGAVYVIPDAGIHPLGPLIERLKVVPEGAFNL